MHYLSDEILLLECKNEEKLSRGMGAVNTLIVLGPDELLVIDPGVWTYQYKIMKKLHKREIFDLSKVKKVCITHQHWDHSTFASYFQRKFGAKILSHIKEKEALEDEMVMLENFFRGYKFFKYELEKYPLWIMRKAIHFLWGKYQGVKINQTLKDGDKLGNTISVQVVELPGHTLGNVGFYFPTEKILAAGDLIDLETGIGFDLNSPLSCYETAKKSVGKLIDMQIETFISGHGEIVQGLEECNALFENKINNSINLRERIIEVLSEKECSLKELIAKVTQNRSIIDYLLNKQVFYCYLESIDREKSIEFQKKGKKTLMKL